MPFIAALLASAYAAGEPADNLAREGLALKKGDLLSLGSFSRLLPPAPGLGVEVQYLGLPGDPKVAVFFQ